MGYHSLDLFQGIEKGKEEDEEGKEEGKKFASLPDMKR